MIALYTFTPLYCPSCGAPTRLDRIDNALAGKYQARQALNCPFCGVMFQLATKKDLLADPGKRAALEERNAAEVPFYAAVRDEIFPKYIEAYGPGLAEDVERFRGSGFGRVNTVNLNLNKVYRRFVLPRCVERRLRSEGV